MNIDKNSLTENFISRQIVTEILNFGVTQQQILQVIYLLSLELEDRDKSVSIANIAKDKNEKQVKNNALIIEPN
jgi:hypothetical protein